jgi:hypothetical protein
VDCGDATGLTYEGMTRSAGWERAGEAVDALVGVAASAADATDSPAASAVDGPKVDEQAVAAPVSGPGDRSLCLAPYFAGR